MGCIGSKDGAVDANKSQGNRSNRSKSSGKLTGADAPKPIPEFGLGEDFTTLKWLGSGGTGETYLCRDNKSGERVAIKLISRPLPKALIPMITAEIQIQAALGDGHLCLVKSKEVIMTPSHVGLVMEYAEGGTLTAHVSARWNSTDKRGGLFLDEDEARYFFKQFMYAVEYCHLRNVAYRDLKLDNTLLDGSDPPLIKICDFGFARAWQGDNRSMFTTIGTPVYMSPEIIGAKSNGVGYDAAKTDVWACGVLLFVMLAGMFPYDHQDNPDPNTSAAHIEIQLQQIKCSWREHERIATFANRLTPECCDLLDRMFDLEIEKRPDITAIKQHPWYNKPLPPKLQSALAKLEADQAKIAPVAPGMLAESPALQVKLDALLGLAQIPPSGMDPLVRVSLKAKESRLQPVQSYIGGGAGPEDVSVEV